MSHRPHLRLRGVGAISYNSWSLLVFLQGKVNSACYIAQVVNPLLLPFIRQEGDVLFQQDSTRPHMATAMHCALHGVQQFSWPARTPDLSPIERIWDMLKWELYSFARACHNHYQFATMGIRCLGKSIAG